jgi:hypothetical protein
MITTTLSIATPDLAIVAAGGSGDHSCRPVVTIDTRRVVTGGRRG